MPRRFKLVSVALAAVLAASCGRLDANAACAQLESVGASECKETKPDGVAYLLVSRAAEFKIEGSDKPGRVLQFDGDEQFKKTSEALDGLSKLTGQTVIAYPARRMIVELPKGADPVTVAAFRRAVADW